MKDRGTDTDGDTTVHILVTEKLSGRVYGNLRKRVGLGDVFPDDSDEFPHVDDDDVERAKQNARDLGLTSREVGKLVSDHLITRGFGDGSQGRRAAEKLVQEELDKLSK